MRGVRKNENERAMNTTKDQGRNNRSGGDAMSASMLQLILSFGEADCEQTRDPEVYTRRRPAA
jgi:hypothetical protein